MNTKYNSNQILNQITKIDYKNKQFFEKISSSIGKRVIDLLLLNPNRFISRKFLAWVTATGLCAFGTVTSDNWTAITLAYIGTQALVDMAVKWKHGAAAQ